MRRHVIPLLVICAVLFGGFYLAMHIPALSERVVSDLTARYLPMVRIEGFQVGAQRYHWPDTVAMRDVRFRVVKYGQTYRVRAARMVFEDIMTDWKTGQRVKIHFQGVEAQGSRLHVRQLNCRIILGFQGDRLAGVDGIFKSGEIGITPYRLTDVIGRLRADRKKLELFDLVASGYGGDVKGQFIWEYDNALSYVLWMEFNRVQAGRLERVNPFLFRRVAGALDGHVRLNGYPHQLEIMDIVLNGRDLDLAPLLLQRLLPLLPKDKQGELAPWARKTQPVRVANARLQIQNLSDQKADLIYALSDPSKGLSIEGSAVLFAGEGWLSYLLAPEADTTSIVR